MRRVAVEVSVVLLLLLILGFRPDLNPVWVAHMFWNHRTAVDLRAALMAIDESVRKTGHPPRDRAAALQVIRETVSRPAAAVRDGRFEYFANERHYLLVWQAANWPNDLGQFIGFDGQQAYSVHECARVILVPALLGESPRGGA